ncbi:hypothetical protein ACFJPD_003661 [Salmonella enterica]
MLVIAEALDDHQATPLAANLAEADVLDTGGIPIFTHVYASCSLSTYAQGLPVRGALLG